MMGVVRPISSEYSSNNVVMTTEYLWVRTCGLVSSHRNMASRPSLYVCCGSGLDSPLPSELPQLLVSDIQQIDVTTAPPS